MTFQNKKPSKVRQEGNTLVAAFGNANPPLIWKFDLERNHSFSLALQGEDGDWELGVLSPKEEFHPVARFLSREDAEEAFAKTQKALLSCHKNFWRTWALFSTAIGVILAILSIFCFVGGSPAAPAADQAAPQPAASTSAPAAAAVIPAAPPVKNGVPLDADKILQPPSR